MKNKRKKKPVWRKIYEENWRLCHEIVDLRDGRACIIPGCGVTDKLDLDHGISRAHKIVFFDTRHLGYLCKKHHQSKSFNSNNWVAKTVDQIHAVREGQIIWDGMVDAAKKCCPTFSTLAYQEKINEELKRELEFLLMRSEESRNKTQV